MNPHLLEKIGIAVIAVWVAYFVVRLAVPVGKGPLRDPATGGPLTQSYSYGLRDRSITHPTTNWAPTIIIFLAVIGLAVLVYMASCQQWDTLVVPVPK